MDALPDDELWGRSRLQRYFDNLPIRSLERLVKTPGFPAPIYVGRRPMWRPSQVREWQGCRRSA